MTSEVQDRSGPERAGAGHQAAAAGQPGPADQDAAPHTTAGKIADLQRRRDEAIHAGSGGAVERQHAKGTLTARERVDRLLDPGSFTEFDELARHRATDFGVAANRPYGDGVVTGYGTVDGRPGCGFSPDLTVVGGARGGAVLPPGNHGLPLEGGGGEPHVHHRTRRDQDGDRGGRDLRGPRRRA